MESASWDHLEPQWGSVSVGEEDGINACWEGYWKVLLCDLYWLYWWAAGRWAKTETVLGTVPSCDRVGEGTVLDVCVINEGVTFTRVSFQQRQMA